MSKIHHAAELAARLSHISHFRQSSPDFRAAHFARTGNYYASASPYACAKDALALIRIGQGAARWAVRQCNGIERYQGNGIWCGTWTEADETACEKAKARAVKKANEIGLYYGVTFTAGGDPRGYVFKMHFPVTGSAVETYGVA